MVQQQLLVNLVKQKYAVVAKVSKLKGLIIRVIGSSFIISIAINIPISKIEFFKYGI